MECFRNYIGMRGQGLPVPASGLYIESLPSITLESIDKLAKPDQVTHMQVWQDVQTRAIKRLLRDATALFGKRYLLKTIQRSINLGRKVDATDITAAASVLRGFYIEMDSGLADGYVSSSLQMLYVQSLSIYITEVPLDGSDPRAFNLKIIDADTNEVLLTKAINNEAIPLTVGWNKIDIEGFYSARKLFCCYEAQYVDGVNLQIPVAINDLYCSSVCSIYGEASNGNIYGAQADDANSDITTGENTFGLSGVFSLVCSFASILCDNRALFAEALWYQNGAELAVERMFTPRMNYWKITLEEAQRLKGLFQGRYEDDLQVAVDGIALDMNDCCIECDTPITVRSARM